METSMQFPASSRLFLLLACGVSWSAQAGLESILNPMARGNPYVMTSPPLAGVLGLDNPYGNFNPLGGVDGALALITLGATPLPLGPLGMGAGTMMYPGLQMMPNMMSHQHINSMSNPYMGGPFAGNPYLRPSMPVPFAPPAFSPSAPTLPFAGFGQANPSPRSAFTPGQAQGAPGFMIPGQPVAPGFSPPFALPVAPAAPAAPRPQAPAMPWPLMPSPPVQQGGGGYPSSPIPASPAGPQATSTPPATPALLPFDPAAWLGQFSAPAK